MRECSAFFFLLLPNVSAGRASPHYLDPTWPAAADRIGSSIPAARRVLICQFEDVCGVSGHGLPACWGLRLAADNYDGELRNQRGDRADGGEERSQDGADGSDGHGNLDERVAVLVLYHDALDVALVDQVADLIDEVAAQDMNFFNKTLETHNLDYVGAWRQVPKQLN